MRHFTHRMLLHVLYAVLLMVLTIAVGATAHIWLEPVHWHDALLNTAFIVGGVGAYIVPESLGGKLFFAVYGIFVGLAFMATMGLVLAPVAHRIIHTLHLDDDAD